MVQWLSADDETVRKHLTAKLQSAQGASPQKVLGYTDPGQRRKCFLEATKIYHPSRFARRPKDIRDLATSLFILLKEAYEAGNVQDTAQELEQARRAAAVASGTRGTHRAGGSVGDTSSARQEQRRRRRETLRRRFEQHTAAVRVVSSTDQKIEPANEEERFAANCRYLDTNDFAKAAAGFRTLAVGRPADKRYRVYMHYAQGCEHKDAGQLEEARVEFKRALGLDANFEPAQEALVATSGTGKAGFFSKLFGK